MQSHDSIKNALDKNQKLCYTYDEQSSVTKRTVISLSGTTETEETFSYDGAGNVTADNNHTFVYDENNRLTEYDGNAVTYDADGNMLSEGTTTFSYDSGNRLTSAGGHTYTYNAENVRIRNLCADADTTYVYNTNCKLSQLLCKTTNGIITKYVYGLGLIGEEKENCFKTYHFDYRGSTVAITDTNGIITDTFAYDTYGKLISRTGSSFVIFGYNGRDGVVTDKNGLIYMRARYYSPELRRFINADIVSGSIDNSVTLNRFAYANGNPVSFIDSFGLSPERGSGECDSFDSVFHKLKNNTEVFSGLSESILEFLKNTFGAGATTSYVVDSNDFFSRTFGIITAGSRLTNSYTGGDTSKPISLYCNFSAKDWLKSSIGIKLNFKGAQVSTNFNLFGEQSTKFVFYDDNNCSTDITVKTLGLDGLHIEYASTEYEMDNVNTSEYIGVSVGKIAGIVAVLCYLPELIPIVAPAVKEAIPVMIEAFPN